jgi:signal transduction histidine kinase
MVHMMADQARKAGVNLNTRISPELPRLRGDGRRLQQVLLNLVSNAIKFTPAGGNVTVGVEAADAGMILVVKDTGIGMKPEQIPLAFERFRQIDNTFSRKYDGAGLGLPLARDLVELHGGRLTLESTPNAGTTATVSFPASRLASPPDANTSRELWLSTSPHTPRKATVAA